MTALKAPIRQLLFRVYKQENVLEVWAFDTKRGSLSSIANYEVCYMLGEAGPNIKAQDSVQGCCMGRGER